MRAYLVIGVLGSLGEQLTQHGRISRQDRVDLCFYHFCACTRTVVRENETVAFYGSKMREGREGHLHHAR